VRTIRFAMAYMGPYRGRYLLGLAALLAASFVVMLPPVILGVAIDAITDAVNGDGDVNDWQLARYAVAFLALAAVEGFLRFASRLLVSGTSRKVEYDIRDDLASHQFKLDQRFYLKSQTGDLMARSTNDLQMVRDLLGPSLLDLARVIAMMFFGFFFLVALNPKLGLLAYAYLPVVGIVIAAFGHQVELRYWRVQEQFGVLSTRVQENVSGARTIKAYAMEGTESASFEGLNGEMMKRSMSWAYFTAALWPLMSVATGASAVLVLWFGGNDVVDGKMTLGEFVQFNAYLVVLANPLMSLGWTATAIQQGAASLRRIEEVLDTPPAITDPVAPEAPGTVRGEVEFRDVSFAYQGQPVLSHINLRIPAGTVLAIVGATGAGKTTLVNLLARLWDPDEGAVLLDGNDIRRLPVRRLRDAIAFVPQETFLFSEALHDNIRYGRAGAPDEAVHEAVAISRLEADLPQLTHGLDTVIGERGVTLSGGQKQRLCLARAVLADAPVLILDEATSNLDPASEREVQDALERVLEGRTAIVIAHRLSSIARAHSIAVLKSGRVIEQGRHDELLARGTAYAQLWAAQH
jgi:ATP-binding cassette subfamily B protein